MGAIGKAVNEALTAKAAQRHLAYDHYGLPYTAVGIDWWKLTNVQAPEYALSERQGRNMLRAYIRSLTTDCPAIRIGVIGYSQGAQVVGDVFSRKVGGLTATQLAQVKAVALVADPRFNSQEPYDRGSFRNGRNGLLGARSPGDLSSVFGKVAAWCRRDDLICQGPGTTSNHAAANYLADYKAQIIHFLADKLGFPVRPAGGEGVVSASAVGPLRFGVASGVDENHFAGDPDRVFTASAPGAWAGFDGWDVVMISPGTILDGFRCPGKIGKAPCMTIYAYDRRYKLGGFYTDSSRFRTAHGSTVGMTVTEVLARERDATWSGTQVQCPGVIMAAPAGSRFRLDVDARTLKVDGIYVSVAKTFADGCG